MLVLNTLPVPVLLVTILGLVPFKLRVVALAAVIVVLRKFKVPVVAPTVIVVAAPKAFTVVALLSNKLAVLPELLVIGL